MSNLERFFLIGLGALAVIMVAVVVAGPLAARLRAPSEPALEVGDTETMEARVVTVLEEGTVDLGTGMSQPYQKLLLRVEGGSMAGQEVVVDEGTVNIINQERLFGPGDRVFLERAIGPNGDRFYISDFVRTRSLLWMVLLFVGLVVLVGRGRGARSLLGTLVSVVVIFGGVLPAIKAYYDPVLICVAGSAIMLIGSTVLTYGLQWKTYAAVTGMVASLLLTWVLASVFVAWARLTGLTLEESSFLVMELGSGLDFRGLVLGGIIIGSLGVLDDICVGQASSVFELVNANRELTWPQLFRSSLNIGRDHIAAMVNTLFLAYVGASLPLMLVFSIYQEPLWRRINREPIAEEIVRTLAGSLGLLLAVPITGLIASLFARWAVRRAQARRAMSQELKTEAEEIGPVG